MYVNVVICNNLMVFFLIFNRIQNIFNYFKRKKNGEKYKNNITQSEICSGIPLFIEHIPKKKIFSLLIILNNDTIMFLLCIYLCKGIKVKRCSGIKTNFKK